jgi:hypothetical protein
MPDRPGGLDTVPGQLDELRMRLDDGDRKRAAMQRSIERIEGDVVDVKKALDANTALTEENTAITKQTADVVKEIRDYQTALRVIRKLLIALGTVAAAAIAIWQFIVAFHTGAPPK